MSLITLLIAIRYFIDKDWRYYEVILGFDPIPGKHKGLGLAQLVQQALQECGLSLSQVSAMTADNASNNKTLHASLIEALNILKKDSNDTILIRVPCLAHIIQIACNNILSEISNGRELFPDTQSRESQKKGGGPTATVQKVSLIT